MPKKFFPDFKAEINALRAHHSALSINGFHKHILSEHPDVLFKHEVDNISYSVLLMMLNPEYEQRRREHKREHMREYHQKPEVKQREREYKREYSQRPEVKQRRREHKCEHMREYNQRPDVKQRKREYNQRPEVKQRKREYNRKYHQRPEIKQHTREYNREYMRKYSQIPKLDIEDAILNLFDKEACSVEYLRGRFLEEYNIRVQPSEIERAIQRLQERLGPNSPIVDAEEPSRDETLYKLNRASPYWRVCDGFARSME